MAQPTPNVNFPLKKRRPMNQLWIKYIVNNPVTNQNMHRGTLDPSQGGYDVIRRRNATYGLAPTGSAKLSHLPAVKPDAVLHTVQADWDESVQGPPAEVEVSIRTSSYNTTDGYPLLEDGNGVVVVRAEEALIVILVLLLWVAAIALFFNRWGKIRMLEPYQPKFQQQHRQSCAMVESQSVLPHRTSFSRTCLGDNSLYAAGPIHPLLRPRQNSVFVGSTTTVAFIPENNPPRKSKSAMDIQSLVHEEAGTSGEGPSGQRGPRGRNLSPTAGFVPGNSLGVSCSRARSPSLVGHGLGHSAGHLSAHQAGHVLGHSAGHLPGHSLGHLSGHSLLYSPLASSYSRGNSLGGFGTPGRPGLLSASSSTSARMHRNSICMERPSTSKGNYLTVTNV